MPPPSWMTRRRWLQAAALCAASPTALPAHDYRAGKVLIDHPYAPPTPAAASTGAVYFRALHNQGNDLERLLGARCAVSTSVEIHQMTMDGDVMRMRALPALELPPGQELRPRHGGPLHLMLIGLRRPLSVGDRFALELEFERAGRKEVIIWVQQPRADRTEPSAPGTGHMH